MDGHFSNNHNNNQQQHPQLFGGLGLGSVADIPLDQVAGGASFGDDFDLHRSVGGVATLLPAPLHFRSRSHSHSHGGPQFGLGLGQQQQHAALASVAALAPPKFTSTSSSSLSNKPPAPSAFARAGAVAAVAEAAPAEWEEAAVVVPELPPFDGFLEANDHVFLDGAQGVGAVARLLEACFRRLRVDWAFKPGKCKWKAARVGSGAGMGFAAGGHQGLGPASPPPLGWPLLPHASPLQQQQRGVGGGQGASVDFRCRVYRARGGRLVLEFQRRQVRYGFDSCVCGCIG